MMEALKHQEFEEKEPIEREAVGSYWCAVWRYRFIQPHRVCPNRITKALSLFPKCVFCNFEGSGVEGIRKRMGWSKREMARRMEIPWKTYQEISTFRRSGSRSDLYSKIQELIDKVTDSPGQYITQEMIREITVSPLDFFNRYIGRFPWEEKNRWPSPIWRKSAQKEIFKGVGANLPNATII